MKVALIYMTHPQCIKYAFLHILTNIFIYFLFRMMAKQLQWI